MSSECARQMTRQFLLGERCRAMITTDRLLMLGGGKNKSLPKSFPKHKKSCRYMFPGELGESLMDNETAKDEELSVRISKYLSPEYQSEKQAEEQQEIQMETFTDDEVTDH